MAATINEDLRCSWHPFACSDTSMRPNTLLVMKLTFLLLLVSGFPRQLFAGFIPWWAIGDLPAQDGALRAALAATFFAAGTFIMFNRVVRLASMTAGVTVFLVLLLSQPAFHAGTVLGGCILLLGGYQGRRDHPSFVQWQLVVVHFALFLSATNGTAWVGALTTEAWVYDEPPLPLLRDTARLLPSGWLHHGLAWLVLSAELLLTIGLAVRPLRRGAVFLSLAFHVALYGVMGTREVAVLVAAIAIGTISFLHWPPTTVTVIWPRACGWPVWLRALIERTDWDRQIDWPRPRDPDGELVVIRDGTETQGWSAMRTLLLFHPAFHFGLLAVLVTLVATLPPPWRAPLSAAIALVCLLFFARRAIPIARNRPVPAGNQPQIVSPD